jgi:hypothetical protein
MPLFPSGLGGKSMIVKVYKGGGRQARPAGGARQGGLVYRLFMRWFGRGSFRA